MNILFIQWQHITQLPNGASVYEQNMARWLKSIGHQVRCTGHYQTNGCYDGVDYFPFKVKKTLEQWADLIIARVSDARNTGKPTIWIQHNEHKEPFNLEHGRVIYCAHHVSSMAYKCQGSAVKWPFNRYMDSEPLPAKGDGKVTLVNCNANKGGAVLRTLADALPDVQFLGITGGYGAQIKHVTPNIEYRMGCLGIKEMLRDTSVLIMPSITEGLPTIALEALSLGIPVLMNQIPAATELMCSAASLPNFAGRLKLMLGNYDKARAYALELAEAHKMVHLDQLESLVNWI